MTPNPTGKSGIAVATGGIDGLEPGPARSVTSERADSRTMEPVDRPDGNHGPIPLLFNALLEASTKISFHTSGNKHLRREEAACD